MSYLFELDNVTKSYNDKKVLDVTSLCFKKGAVYGIMGANGAGKSTLLSILAFLLPPTSGKIYWEGRDVATLDKHLLRKKVTLTTQNPYLFHTTVGKNVAYGLKIRGIKGENRERKVKECLQVVGLEGFEKRIAPELSGGEIQRVAIARALALDPQVLLLDEPTANVDRYGVEQLSTILKELNEGLGITIILATHDADQSFRLAQDVIHLSEGRVVPHSHMAEQNASST